MDKKKKLFPRTHLSEEISKEFVSLDELKTDPLGMWTGRPMDKDDVPTQDVDDL